MENESDARADIIELSDYACQRARSRLAGLTDDEYFWECARLLYGPPNRVR
jgi:hypothetical protein